MCDISTSFKKQCTSFNDGLKQRALLEEAAIVNKSCDERRGSGSLRSTKPRGKSKTKAGAAQADVMADVWRGQLVHLPRASYIGAPPPQSCPRQLEYRTISFEVEICIHRLAVGEDLFLRDFRLSTFTDQLFPL